LTDVSEALTVSIIRALTDVSGALTVFIMTDLLEAVSTSETSVNIYKTSANGTAIIISIIIIIASSIYLTVETA
jgi:hypothetical protein